MTEIEEGASQALYYALKSADGGATWELIGSYRAASRDAALHAAFPETEDGTQYVAVASSFWQPVTPKAREVRYVRSVKSLQPVDQPALFAPEDERPGELAADPADQIQLDDDDLPSRDDATEPVLA